jgi:ABC-type anion transport system duplicated permease subunit
MNRSGISLLALIWIVVGIVVAATHHFFNHLTTVGSILSAVLAVILWPLILLGVKIAIAI